MALRYTPGMSTRLEQAADTVISAFSWSDSPEGGDYWDNIHTSLRKHASAAKAQDQKEERERAEEAAAALKARTLTARIEEIALSLRDK